MHLINKKTICSKKNVSTPNTTNKIQLFPTILAIIADKKLKSSNPDCAIKT